MPSERREEVRRREGRASPSDGAMLREATLAVQC